MEKYLHDFYFAIFAIIICEDVCPQNLNYRNSKNENCEILALRNWSTLQYFFSSQTKGAAINIYCVSQLWNTVQLLCIHHISTFSDSLNSISCIAFYNEYFKKLASTSFKTSLNFSGLLFLGAHRTSLSVIGVFLILILKWLWNTIEIEVNCSIYQ
jgi:hypothetical protein